MVVRRATHAGSWYTSNGHELSRELDHWLQKAGPVEKPARAIIGKYLIFAKESLPVGLFTKICC